MGSIDITNLWIDYGPLKLKCIALKQMELVAHALHNFNYLQDLISKVFNFSRESALEEVGFS